MKQSLLSLSLALFLACSLPLQPPDNTFHGSTAFSEAERLQISIGNSWIAGMIHEDPYDLVWDWEPGEPKPPFAIERGGIDRERHARAVGVRLRGSGGIQLDVEGLVDGRCALISVAAHEFGHARGLDHHLGRGVMNGQCTPEVFVWTEEDYEGCVRDLVCFP